MPSKDFSGQNLRGRSFKGQNLEGADFRHADIRGANFTNAYLRGANFSHAQAGLQKRWAIFLVLIACFFSVVSGFFGALDGYFVAFIFRSVGNQIFVWISLIILSIFYVVMIYRGLTSGAIAGVVAVAVAVVGIVAGVVAGVVAGDVIIAGSLAGAFAVAGSAVVTFAVAGVFAGAVAFAFAVAGVVAGVFGFVFAFVGAFVVAVSFAGAVALVFAGAFAGAGAVAVAVAAVGVLLDVYIAWQAMKGNEKYSWIRTFVITIASTGGTSFRNANLTDVNFTSARLKSSDLKKSVLIHTNLYQAEMLDLIRPGNTYLKNSQIRQLLVTKQGQDRNFDRLDLRGINLQKANLTDASFIGADLSEANLQDADLSRAKLVQTQLDSTDFTGTTLTGAYIQDWGITSGTKFDGVKCEYVYMRLPTKENPDPLRKPDNNREVFANGDFGDFIQPIFDTLDLYHNQKVDPRAIAISFKQLAENNPDANLEIVAMEKRGEDKFLLRAKTSDSADKSELSNEYFSTYNQIKGLPEREIQLLLAEKDSRIRSLETMVMTALERPNFYSSTQIQKVDSMTSNPSSFSVGGNIGGNVNNVQGDNNRVVQGNNNQAVLGDNNQVTQQNQVGTVESLTKEDVVKLLAELETLVKSAELPVDTKEEVIEDLSAARKATDKDQPNKQRALDKLTTVAETLKKTSEGVEAGNKIWTAAKPIVIKVATWLGAAVGSYLLGL